MSGCGIRSSTDTILISTRLDLAVKTGADNPGKCPGYGLTSIFGGYRFDMEKFQIGINLFVDNLFNVLYLADATNNAGTSLITTNYLESSPQATITFDANSTAVYIGFPRTFSISAVLTL